MMSTSGLGYMIPVMMKLYGISPVLVVGMIIFVLILIHFILRLDNRIERLKETTLLPDVSKKLSDSDTLNLNLVPVDNEELEWEYDDDQEETKLILKSRRFSLMEAEKYWIEINQSHKTTTIGIGSCECRI